MNTSILVSSFKYIDRCFNIISSLAIWIYQEMSKIKYTDDKLITTFINQHFDIARSIIYLNDDTHILKKIFRDYVENYRDNSFKYEVIDALASVHIRILEDAFCYACRNNIIVLIKQLLLRSDFDISSSTGLFCGCLYGHLNVVSVVLNTGAKLDEDSLYIACREGHISIVNLLIDKYGAKVTKDLIQCAKNNNHDDLASELSKRLKN